LWLPNAHTNVLVDIQLYKYIDIPIYKHIVICDYQVHIQMNFTNILIYLYVHIAGFVITNAFGQVLDEKLVAENYLKASGLDYTIGSLYILYIYIYIFIYIYIYIYVHMYVYLFGLHRRFFPHSLPKTPPSPPRFPPFETSLSITDSHVSKCSTCIYMCICIYIHICIYVCKLYIDDVQYRYIHV